LKYALISIRSPRSGGREKAIHPAAASRAIAAGATVVVVKGMPAYTDGGNGIMDLAGAHMSHRELESHVTLTRATAIPRQAAVGTAIHIHMI